MLRFWARIIGIIPAFLNSNCYLKLKKKHCALKFCLFDLKAVLVPLLLCLVLLPGVCSQPTLFSGFWQDSPSGSHWQERYWGQDQGRSQAVFLPLAATGAVPARPFSSWAPGRAGQNFLPWAQLTGGREPVRWAEPPSDAQCGPGVLAMMPAAEMSALSCCYKSLSCFSSTCLVFIYHICKQLPVLDPFHLKYLAWLLFSYVDPGSYCAFQVFPTCKYSQEAYF